MTDHSNLPAPYESPWLQLGRSLRAVAVSLRLELLILWRRNWAGELALPPFWPRRAAALFWPLLLALALGLITLQLVLAPDLRGPELPQPTAPDRTLETPATTATTGIAPTPDEPPQRALQEQPPASPDEPAAALADHEAQRLQEPFQAGLEAGLIDAVSARPELGELVLRLAPPFDRLEPRRQRRLAEDWLERSLELGFDQLELRDVQGARLGYRARVGSGMILLNPSASS